MAGDLSSETKRQAEQVAAFRAAMAGVDEKLKLYNPHVLQNVANFAAEAALGDVQAREKLSKMFGLGSNWGQWEEFANHVSSMAAGGAAPARREVAPTAPAARTARPEPAPAATPAPGEIGVGFDLTHADEENLFNLRLGMDARNAVIGRLKAKGYTVRPDGAVYRPDGTQVENPAAALSAPTSPDPVVAAERGRSAEQYDRNMKSLRSLILNGQVGDLLSGLGSFSEDFRSLVISDSAIFAELSHLVDVRKSIGGVANAELGVMRMKGEKALETLTADTPPEVLPAEVFQWLNGLPQAGEPLCKDNVLKLIGEMRTAAGSSRDLADFDKQILALRGRLGSTADGQQLLTSGVFSVTEKLFVALRLPAIDSKWHYLGRHVKAGDTIRLAFDGVSGYDPTAFSGIRDVQRSVADSLIPGIDFADIDVMRRIGDTRDITTCVIAMDGLRAAEKKSEALGGLEKSIVKLRTKLDKLVANGELAGVQADKIILSVLNGAIQNLTIDRNTSSVTASFETPNFGTPDDCVRLVNIAAKRYLDSDGGEHYMLGNDRQLVEFGKTVRKQELESVDDLETLTPKDKNKSTEAVRQQVRDRIYPTERGISAEDVSTHTKKWARNNDPFAFIEGLFGRKRR